MKKLSLILFCIVLSLPSIAQSLGPAFFIYRNDGQFNAFFREEVDSITYSYFDADSLRHDQVVTQLIYTQDSIWRIPISVIDSVGYVTPETKYKEEAVLLSGNLFDYLISVDKLKLTFSSSIPTTLLPKINDKLVTTDLTEKLPCGFSGKVRDISSSPQGYNVYCDSMGLEEVVDRFYGVAEFVSCSGNNAREHISMKANSQQIYIIPTTNLPEFNIPLELSSFITKKDVFDISGKASVNMNIKPTLTGKVTRIVDNFLGISHYNIHAVTNLETTTKVEIAGEANKEFVDPWFDKDIPMPWGYPLYVAFGPKCEFSGEIAVGTTIYANFRHTVDITYYPITTFVTPIVPAANLFNSVDQHSEMTHFQMDWAYVAARSSVKAGLFLRVGLPFGTHQVGWAGGEFEGGAKCDIEFMVDFQKLRQADQNCAFYDELKDYHKVDIYPYYGARFILNALPASNGDNQYRLSFKLGDDYLIDDYKFYQGAVLPLFSETKLERSADNPSNLIATTKVTNDCLIPFNVGFALFDSNGRLASDLKFNDKMYWKRSSFQSYTLSFDQLKSGGKYKVYPIVGLFGYNILASPSDEIELEFPVEIEKVEVIKSTYYPNHYTYNNKQYSFKYDCQTYINLKDNANIEDWGYVYIDPDGNQSDLISLKDFGNHIADPRFSYCRNTSKSTIKFKGYVKYKDSNDICYGEPFEFPIEYANESSITMTNCTYQGTETNVSYQGQTYKYKSTFRFLFTVTGAYWIKVETDESGSGWNNWNSLPNNSTSPVDGANALTVNYYYNDKTFVGNYDVYLKATDATHAKTHITQEYATYSYSDNQFTGCTYHSNTNAVRMHNDIKSIAEKKYNNIIINKSFY